VYVKKDTLEMGVNSAILSFNEGTAGLKRVFEYLNMTRGVKTSSGSLKKDKRRLSNMKRKEKSPIKKRRVQLTGYLKAGLARNKNLKLKNRILLEVFRSFL